MKLIVRAALVITGLAVVATAVLCHYRLEANFRCVRCLARRTDSQWRLGLMPLGHALFHDAGSAHGLSSLPLTPQRSQVSPSVATTELFPSTHHHSWEFAQASPYFLFGTKWGGCALGGSYRYSPVAHMYLGDPRFRAYVARESRAHRVTQKALEDMFAAANRTAPPALVEQGVALVLEYYRLYPNPSQEKTFREIFRDGA